MTDIRDRYFQGFAKLLLADLKECDNEAFLKQEKYDSYQERVTRLVAQRAYDLVVHVLEHAQDDVYYNPHSLIAQGMIPDLTQWPEYRLDRNDND